MNSSTVKPNTQILWEKQLASLNQFCMKKGWKVEDTNDPKAIDCAYITENRIVLRQHLNPEIKFYFFLHEIGHMLLANNTPVYDNRYEYIFKNLSKGSLTYSVKCIEEEVESWRLGYDLAREYNLFVNILTFEKIKAVSLLTYFQWIIDKRTLKNNQRIKKSIATANAYSSTHENDYTNEDNKEND